MKYPISKEFFPYTHLTPPYICPGFAKLCGDLMRPPRSLWRDSRVDVTCHKIKSYDQKEITVLMIAPKGVKEVLPCMVYCHGGAFSYSASPAHYHNTIRYATEVGMRIAFVQYRRAPKYRFPTPGEDCFAAYKWVAENADELMIDPDRIAVGGDSAGGALAALLSRLVAERVAKKPVFQLLIYPVLDMRCSTRSQLEFTDTPMWNSRLSRLMWQGYLGKAPDEGILSYASPSLIEDISCMPPSYIETAEFDCLRDEARDFALRLMTAGVPTVLNETLTTLHGFDARTDAPKTLEVVATRINYMKKMLYGEGDTEI